MANNKCKECGCACSNCKVTDQDVHLHVEIENLKQRLVERDNHILTMETNFLNEANKFPNGEMVAIREELLTWQDKYRRLYEAHRRVQRVNQGLEDKLLKLVDVCETDKNTLTKDVATLSRKLAEANYTIKKLTEDNERYKNDVLLAIQLLQCKPGNFVSQKVDNLPNEVQKKVSTYMANKRKPLDERKPHHSEMKSIKVPIPTFPPTAMAYSLPKSPNSTRRSDTAETEPTAEVDIVSAAIMAKVLEEREKERANMKHCETCTCPQRNNIHISNNTQDIGSQTNDVNITQCYKYERALEQNQIVNVKRTESRGKSTYVHDYDNHNIAMVEPNNFLSENNKLQNLVTSNCTYKKVDSKLDHVLSKMQQNNQEKLNSVPKHQVINYVQIGNLSEMDFFTSNNRKLECSILDRNINTRKNIPYVQQNVGSTNLNVENYQMITPQHVDSNNHHRASNLLSFTVQNSTKPTTNSTNELCSKHSQASSRNLLLDNLHDSFKGCEINEHRITTIADTSTNKRVSEWIENNMDVNVSDNSQCESSHSVRTSGDDTVPIIDKEKYVEMENNVKRFLFGESGFLRTVEIDKEKYNCKGNVTHSNKCKVGRSLDKNNSM